MADADPVFDAPATGQGGSAQDDTYTGKPAPRWRKRLLMFGVPVLVVIAGAAYWLSLQGRVSTDNAYVKQDKVAVGAQVSGPIAQVFIKAGQSVKPGDLLFRIDPDPFKVQVQQANAAIATAQANVTALSNAPEITGVDIDAAREDIGFAQSKLARQKALWARGFTTKADLDAAQHAVSQAQEEMRQAQVKQTEARAKLASGAAVPGQNPQVAAAIAQRDAALLNLSRTEVRAPMAGRIAQTDKPEVGQQIISGMPVVTIVGDETSYVEANFKETDLDNMKPGQPARVTFDAYPDIALKGHVAFIGAGTGSEFSVLPAQNATGNWVKVTQRVPVRIHLDEKSPHPLIAGLSTHVTVYTDGKKH